MKFSLGFQPVVQAPPSLSTSRFPGISCSCFRSAELLPVCCVHLCSQASCHLNKIKDSGQHTAEWTNCLKPSAASVLSSTTLYHLSIPHPSRVLWSFQDCLAVVRQNVPPVRGAFSPASCNSIRSWASEHRLAVLWTLGVKRNISLPNAFKGLAAYFTKGNYEGNRSISRIQRLVVRSGVEGSGLERADLARLDSKIRGSQVVPWLWRDRSDCQG